MPPRKGVSDALDSKDNPGLFGWAGCRIACTSKVHSLALTLVFQLRSVWRSRAVVITFYLSVESWEESRWLGNCRPHTLFVGCGELKVHTAFRHPCTQLLQKRRAFSRYLSLSLWQPAGCVGTAFWANSVVLWSSAMTHAFPAPVSCGLSFWDFDMPRAALEDAGACLWASVCKLWLPCLCPAFLWGMEFQNESWTWPWSRQVNAPCS